MPVKGNEYMIFKTIGQKVNEKMNGIFGKTGDDLSLPLSENQIASWKDLVWGVEEIASQKQLHIKNSTLLAAADCSNADERINDERSLDNRSLTHSSSSTFEQQWQLK